MQRRRNAGVGDWQPGVYTQVMSKRRQPQRLPPPIMEGSEAIESEVVLKEFPDELGLLLWKTVRSVRLWSELPDNTGSGAFAPDARQHRGRLIESEGVPEEIRVPLGKAAGVLQPRARSATVSSGCRAIASWAEARGAHGTAIEFLQAAAVALPLDAELAYEVARVARTRTEYQRAETWFRHAISRARRTQNRYEFARSYIGLGNIFIRRGNFPQAKRNLIRGLRAARRFSIRPLIGAAYQELAVVAMHTQSSTEVHRYTRAALEASGTENPKLPCLVFEYGIYLLENGHFAEALRTIASVPNAIIRPIERLERAAAVVRAAAAADERNIYEDAWNAAERLIEDPSTAPAAASALLTMARGAIAAGDVDRALDAAVRARHAAATRGEAEVEFAAVDVLDSLEKGASIEEGASPRKSSPRVRHLVKDLEAAMGGLQPA